VFESFGLTAEVASDDREVFDSLPAALPPGWRPGRGEAVARFELFADGRITCDGDDVAHTETGSDATLQKLGAVMRHHLAEHAPGHVFIHAGVVCAGGTAIVIPGRSHSGKTTLVAALVRAGASYCSDEYAVVDAAGLIEPYPKPLSVRVPGAGLLGVPTPVPAPQIATQPIRAGLIVLTSYHAESQWSPKSLTRGEGAFALLEHTLAARSRPGAALRAVCQLSREASVISGRRGEASAVADALLAFTGESGSNQQFS